MAAVGVLAWALLVPAALLVRRAPVAGNGGGVPAEAGPTAASALTSLPFLVLAGTFFLCCAAHSGPIFHMLSYASFCGIPTMAAVSIYSVEGMAGLGGRLLLGVLADRLGVKLVLVAGLLVQALAIPAYLLVRGIGDFYMLALVFGMAYGGVMPLYAVLAREYFGQRIMGTVLGAATMMSSIGMALGPVAGGWAFDAFGDYRWLFLGSAAIATGAVAIALAFPPLPGDQRRVAPAA
jgi:MFS family permease